MRSASAGFVVLAAVVLAGCGGGGGGGTTSTASAPKKSGGCTDVSKPAPRKPAHLKITPPALNPTVPYRIRVVTNCGDFTITLDLKHSPVTSASFVALVRSGFFNRTIFHRIVPGFVIQGGDPTQKGGGGPGYTTHEPPPKNTRYVRYTVAMAKTAAQPAGTAGSQFFVVTGADAQLPPDYAVLGKVTSGQATVDRIGKLGNAAEQPTRTVEIEKMSLEPS